MYNKCNQSGISIHKPEITYWNKHTQTWKHMLKLLFCYLLRHSTLLFVPLWGKILRYRIIVVITSKPIRKITLIFFFVRGSPKYHTQPSKLSIRKKLNLQMVFCRIIAVIMPKPIQKITLKMLFSVPCCDSQQIFFVALQGNDNIEANSKVYSENAVCCSLLWHSKVFFLWLS